MALAKSGSTFAEVMGELKKGKYRPAYFLTGDEPYYIDQISDYIEQNALSEEEKAFNLLIYYGKEVDVNALNVEARRFPMNAERLVVMVKEAQSAKNLEKLEIYLNSPVASTVLVICHKPKTESSGEKGARLTKMLKQLEKIGGIKFESKKLYDNQVPDWISKYLSEKKISVTPVACQLLTEHLGNDLSKIAHELDKLLVALPQGTTTIDTKQIEDNIGISKDFNRFELTKAISERNILKCNRIINYLAKNAAPLPPIISTIHQHFVRILKTHLMANSSEADLARALGINPFFVREYRGAASKYDIRRTVRFLSMLRDYDLRSKGMERGTIDDGELLRELLFYILHY
ncbi:MAG: DNA polymerase III subunit delta [Bacteroidales bacterium]|nr:DNA polymerase III subunit delta [Bacteroidales bacterium]